MATPHWHEASLAPAYGFMNEKKNVDSTEALIDQKESQKERQVRREGNGEWTII